MSVYTLRTATPDDLQFLYRVSAEAMCPVVEALHGSGKQDKEKEFRKYKENFEPEKIQVIQFNGKDIGRLRVVRSPESIYIGGIQILPEFQGKGVGSAIVSDLIKESHKLHIPITLEVHDVNTRAMAFYKKYGFVESGRQEDLKKAVLTYYPNNY